MQLHLQLNPCYEMYYFIIILMVMIIITVVTIILIITFIIIIISSTPYFGIYRQGMYSLYEYSIIINCLGYLTFIGSSWISIIPDFSNISNFITRSSCI